MMKLHDEYEASAAIEMLCAGQQPAVLCDGQFISSNELVLCFFDITAVGAGARLLAPSLIAWTPAAGNKQPTNWASWLPAEARKPRSATKQSNFHMIFVKRPSSPAYRFLGAAHMGSYGVSDGIAGAEFLLTNKVPRPLWIELGGYSGWRVEVNHSVAHLAADDLRGFRDLLVRASRAEFGHVCLTRYEEDSFHLHTNPRRAWVMYLREPEDPGLYLASGVPSSGPDIDEFRCVCGISLEMPKTRTTTVDDGLAIAEAYFANGRLPEKWQWTEDQG
jgi:hypothetical protein